MKQLLIIRHAKSSWSIVGQDDFDRPLNDRGHRDAPMMAKRLLEKGIAVDTIISSTATRAITTAGYFASAFDISKKNIRKSDQLYHAHSDVYENIICNLEDSVNSVAVFSHNPGITDFVNELTTMRIDDMPTCAIFAIKAEMVHWKDFKDCKKQFWFFDYPKN